MLNDSKSTKNRFILDFLSRKEDIDVVANKTDFNILIRDVMLISIVIYLILQALIHVYRDEH